MKWAEANVLYPSVEEGGHVSAFESIATWQKMAEVNVFHVADGSMIRSHRCIAFHDGVRHSAISQVTDTLAKAAVAGGASGISLGYIWRFLWKASGD